MKDMLDYYDEFTSKKENIQNKTIKPEFQDIMNSKSKELVISVSQRKNSDCKKDRAKTFNVIDNDYSKFDKFSIPKKNPLQEINFK